MLDLVEDERADGQQHGPDGQAEGEPASQALDDITLARVVLIGSWCVVRGHSVFDGRERAWLAGN